MEVKTMKETNDWSDKQKLAFIKIQDIFAELSLSNKEVAEMFTSFDDKNSVYTLFSFVTSHWMRELKIEVK